jgi:hypothetical protein
VTIPPKALEYAETQARLRYPIVVEILTSDGTFAEHIIAGQQRRQEIFINGFKSAFAYLQTQGITISVKSTKCPRHGQEKCGECG